METIGAPDSSTAPTACATGMRCLSTPAGCWILPQPSHSRLQAKSGSSSTISGNFSRLRSFCSKRYVADPDGLTERHGHLAHLLGSSKERCHSKKAGRTARRTRKADIPPRTVPMRTSSCSGASTTTRTAATGRAPGAHGAAERGGGLHVDRDGAGGAQLGPLVTAYDVVGAGRAGRCGRCARARPGRSASASRSVPVQGVVPSGSRVSSATTRSPGCMPGASPAQKPVASDGRAAQRRPSRQRRRRRPARRPAGPCRCAARSPGPAAPPRSPRAQGELLDAERAGDQQRGGAARRARSIRHQRPCRARRRSANGSPCT